MRSVEYRNRKAKARSKTAMRVTVPQIRQTIEQLSAEETWYGLPLCQRMSRKRSYCCSIHTRNAAGTVARARCLKRIAMTEKVEQPKKRLVPAREYVRQKARRATSYSIATICSVAGLAGIVITFLVGMISLSVVLSYDTSLVLPLIVIMIGVMLSFWGVYALGLGVAKKADTMEDVELLTPGKADLLPSIETLVRASTEPTQEQGKVLLRAAINSEDTPQEQLLRPGSTPEGSV